MNLQSLRDPQARSATVDPLVAPWAKWRAPEWQRVPEGLTDEEGEH